MLAFIIAPFLMALLIFVYVRAIKHTRLYKKSLLRIAELIFGILLFGGFVSIMIGFALPTTSLLKRAFTKIGYYWLGFILYFFIGIIIALIIRIIIWLFTKNKGYKVALARNFTVIFVIVFTALMSIYGIVNAHKLRIINYEVVSNKKATLSELNVVLISDLHIGYNVGIKEIEDMTKEINKLNPDVVILAGDIFDNDFDAVEKPEQMVKILNSINSKYGKYATYGNHDIQEKILMGFTFEWSKEAKAKVQADERMNQFIKDAGFTFLYDDSVLIANSVYIYGRPDGEKINFGNKTRVEASKITENLNKDFTIICVNHEPDDLHELAKAGVDIDLSGHTHNGQIWPGTYTIHLAWDNAYGLQKIDNMTSIVTSGVGLFGVNMRTGCYAEIVNIKINFEK